VIFDTTSTLDLRGARVRKTFVLGDLPAVPKEIHLDGARFDEAVRIEGPAGGPKPRIIAPERRPTFAREVSLTNVDVRDLLLVGNVIQTIEFWNVDWPRRRGHYVLRDEHARIRGGESQMAELPDQLPRLRAGPLDGLSSATKSLLASRPFGTG